MVKVEKIQMIEGELEEAKDTLVHCEIQRDKTDLDVAEFEELLEKKIPTKLLKDDIKELEKQIKEKSVLNTYNIKVELTEADILKRQITLKKEKQTLKLNIPEKELRLRLNILKNAKKKIDAPEQQINKLKKNIRDKAFYRPAPRKAPIPPGVN